MRAFSKRYMVWISLIFLAFSGISFDNKKLIFLPLFLSIIVIIYLILRKNKEKHKNIALLSLCLVGAALLGVFGSQALLFSNRKKVEKYSGYHLIEGYVSEVSFKEAYACEYVVRVERVDESKASFDLVVQTDYESYLVRGDFFSATVNILSSEKQNDVRYLQNTNTYDYPLVCLLDENDEIEYLDSKFRLPLMFSSLNSKLSSTLKATMGTKNGSLASALLLGNRDLLGADTLRDFKRAGVYHLLALSGMHVAILIGILDFILKKLYFPTKLRVVLLFLISLFYMSLTCFQLSACRSILMLWVAYLSMLMQRKRDVMTALFVAVSVIALLKPSAVLDVGLQLSFLSTFGVICSSIICAKLKLVRAEKIEFRSARKFAISLLSKLAVVLISSLCVFICTLPVVMICFGEVSLATFFTNIASGFVCEAFMVLSLMTLACSKVLWLYPFFAWMASIVGNFLTESISRISNVKNVMFSLNYPFAKVLVWMLFISFIFMLVVRISRKWLMLVPSVAFALLITVSIVSYHGARSDFVRTEFYLGDGLVISSGEGVYIADMSDGSFSALYEGMEIAKENCFTELDGVIITHYESDHLRSLQMFVKRFKVRAVYLPMPQNQTEGIRMRSLVRILSDAGVKAYLYRANEDLELLGTKLVLSDRSYKAGYAHPSVALTCEYNEKRITVIQKPYFHSYLDKSNAFAKYIGESNYLIFGSDGRALKEEYEIFSDIKEGCEVSFTDFEFFELSDLGNHIDEILIYLNVNHKKYDLK